MASFDVDGAKRAGYSDAEIADYLAKDNAFDVAGARKAGYSDAEIIVHLRKPVKDFNESKKGFGEKLGTVLNMLPRQLGLTGRAAIEGGAEMAGMVTDPFAKMVGLPSSAQGGAAVADLLGLPKAETTAEKVGQAGAKMLSGGGALLKAAQASSKLPGVAGEVSKLLAANPVQQLQAAAGAGTAGGYVKETGGNELAQGVASLVGGVATPLAISGIKGIPQALKGTAEFIAPGLTRQATNPQVDIVITNLLKDSGLKYGDVSQSVLNQLREDVAKALKVGNLDDAALRRLADYRLVGATPRRGNLTLNPADLTREKNTAKFGVNSADPKLQQLGQVENDNAKLLIQRLNELGAGQGDSYSTGQRLVSALSGVDNAATSNIKSLYKQARESAGRNIELDRPFFNNRVDELLAQNNKTRFLPEEIRQQINDFALGQTKINGKVFDTQFNVDVADAFKTDLATAIRGAKDGNVRKAISLVRQAIDETPVMGDIGQQSMDAFNKARAANKQYMSIVERVPALQAVRDGVEPDKFVQDFIIGSGSKASVMDVAKLKAVIKQSPEAMQAVRNQIMVHLKEASLGKGNSDELVTLSQSGLNRALANIGDRKLKLFFTPAEIAKIKSIARVASYEQVQPRGTAVNNSNTAGAALATVFDSIARSPLLSKIPMAPQIAGNVSASITARNALDPTKAIVTPNQGSGVYPFMLPAVAGMGLLSSP